MSVTEQRSGFRLPWAAESKPAEAPVETASSAVEIAAVAEPDPMARATAPETEPAEPPTLTWPDVDRARTAAPTPVVEPLSAAHATTAEPAASPRRDNPLVTGLVRAMREAANAARVEAAAKAVADAEARREQLRAEAATSSTELRKQADEDVSAIREWSRAQLARIREETERRSADRKARLDRDLEIRTIRLDARIEAVGAVTADFEARMTAFYDTLLAENDPARLAGLAERLPDSPGFEDLDDWVVRSEALDPDDAAAAEAAAMAGLDDLEPVAFDAPDFPPTVAGPEPGAGLTVDTVDTVSAAPATPSAERRLMVTGLVSVASIAGFKRALTRLSGVRAVGVTSGPDGEFVFSVTHAPETDLSAAVAGLTAFHPTLELRADGTIVVSVAEPDDHV